MQHELIQFFENEREETGLLIAEAPTGYGKTYQTVQAMYRYLKEHKDGGFLFVTNLLKNLPERELRRIYEEDGRADAFEKEVLILSSPVDTIGEVIDQVRVPDQFCTTAYREMKTSFEKLKKYRSLSSSIRAQLEKQEDEKLRKEFEPEFRHGLQARLTKDFGNDPKKKRNAIRHNKEYQWIRKFYPSVFWEEYRILLMSVKKLMVRNIPLVEPSFPCLSDRMLKNRILCIDEFDASRSVILNHLIEQALSIQADYLELFRQVYSKIRAHRISDKLEETRSTYEKGSRRTWAQLIQESEDIYQYGAMELSIKTDTDAIDRGRNFLFHDTSYHTILDEGKGYIRAVRDENRGQVRIHFEDHDTHEKHQGEPDIKLQSLLRRIHVFLRHVQTYVYGWGKVYADYINSTKDPTEEIFTPVLAVETIYNDYDMTKEQISLMMEELDKSGSWSKKSVVAPDLSFYESGFRFFEFIDDQHHHSKTNLRYLQMANTPEKLLLYLCQKTKVVGLSATAALPTVTGNYDLSYLRTQLKGHYHEFSQDAKERIAQELREQWQAYDDGRVRVELNIVDEGKSGLLLEERLDEIFEKRSLTRKYSAKLTDSEYHQKRYCDIFSAMRAFWEHSDIHAFLCLNKMLPEEGKAELDRALLEQVLEDLRKQFAPEESGGLFILRSGSGFEEDKEKLRDDLSRGEKRFIMSSYQTLGAGQNLQYPVQSREGLIILKEPADTNDSRFSEKDIDALFLGEDTHTVIRLSKESHLGKAELFQFFYQCECLYENGEISRKTLNQMIKEGVKNCSCIPANHTNVNAELKKCPSVHRQVSRDMIQAVGRMNRTFLKNPTVYLFTTENALSAMDPSCLRNRIMTPEMQALAEARYQMGQEYTVPNEARNIAERIAEYGNGYIQRMLRTAWTPDTIELWNTLRLLVLRHPRATSDEWEEDPVLKNYYIHLGGEQDKYYFAQKGDFAEIRLCLDGDREGFDASLREEGLLPSEVSEEQSRLKLILSYPGMREYFKSQGWATGFGNGPYIMSPVLFQNIYKGALGEEAGAFILKRELGITCHELTDPSEFEVFDYSIGDGMYVDFKHWKSGNTFKEKQMRAKILEKLDSIGGKRVFIINLVSDGTSECGSLENGKLIEVPGLLLPDGQVNRTALEKIEEMIHCST